MKLKAFGDENMAHLSAYYYSEEKGEERKLEMEEYLKNLDSKKFKEFMEWKDEMECKFPFIRDALLGKKAPPLQERLLSLGARCSFLLRWRCRER